MDKVFASLIEETKGTSKKIKTMFRKTFEIIQRMLNKRIQEEKSLEPAKTKKLSLKDKRKLLKETYKRVLTKMGREGAIPVLMKMIDTVPEGYLDYELQIDTDAAGKFLNDLTKGKGQISENELGNIANVIKGVGIPAIQHYATGEEKMDKKTAKFGADAINKNVDAYLKSKKDRYDDTYQLPAPEEVKAIASQVQDKSLARIEKGLVPLLFGGLEKMKDGKLARLASEIKRSQINLKNRIPDLAKVVKHASDYRDANKLAKESNLELEFKNQSEFEQFLFQVSKAKQYEKAR